MKKILLAILAVLLVYTAAGWFLLPRFVDQALRQYASEQWDAELTFDNLLLYPFSFSTHLENLVMLDPNGKPLFTASEVNARSGFLGFWTSTASLSSLEVSEPRLFLGESEAEREQMIERLAAWLDSLGSPASTFEIDLLNLKEARLLTKEPMGPKDVVPASFSLITGSFAESRSGPFDLTVVPETGPDQKVTGNVDWSERGAAGKLSILSPDRSPLSFHSDVESVRHLRWKDLGVESSFTIRYSPQHFSLALEQANLSAGSMHIELGYLLEVAAKPLSGQLDLLAEADARGLHIREATVSAGDLRVTGLRNESSGWIDFPVGHADLTLSEFALSGKQAIPFSAQIQMDSRGQISLAGQLDGGTDNGALIFDLTDVSLSSLISPSSGILPTALSQLAISGNGRMQLSHSAPDEQGDVKAQNGPTPDNPAPDASPTSQKADPALDHDPLAAVVFSGQVASGGDFSLSGMTNYATSFDKPLRESRFELGMKGLNARILSAWAEAFAGREVIGGTVGASLRMREIEGESLGSYSLVVEDLQLAKPSGEIQVPAGDPDFTLALLQDDDQKIGISVPLAGNTRSDGLGFSDWLAAEVENYLVRVDDRPFETLARALGIDSGILDAVAFDPGRAGLTAQAVAHMEWLKTALQWRPGLALRVGGGYDPIADRYELAAQQIRLHVNLATAIRSTDRANDVPINFSEPKARSVLEEFAGSRLGPARVQTIASEFQMDETLVGPVRAEAQKLDFYRALFDALVENEEITDRTLQSLARYRARTVIDQLSRHGIDKNRLENVEQVAVSAQVVDGVPVSLELTVYVPPEEEVKQESQSFFSTFD